MNKKIVTGLIALAVILGGFFFFNKETTALSELKILTEENPSSSQNSDNNIDLFAYEEDSATPESLIDHALSPRYIGSLDAPVVFSDFSSLSCPHCASFHNNILPEIKEKYIETGQVRMIFGLMPINPTALMGEQVARCIPKKDFYKTITLLYDNQDVWAFSKNPRQSLIDLVKLAGISQEKAQSCLDNKELELALSEKARKNASQYGIRSTPSFVFDDGAQKFSGARPLNEFANILEPLIKAQEK